LAGLIRIGGVQKASRPMAWPLPAAAIGHSQ
jgi:hypothetical protein